MISPSPLSPSQFTHPSQSPPLSSPWSPPLSPSWSQPVFLSCSPLMKTRTKNKAQHPGIPDMTPAQLSAADLSRPKRPLPRKKMTKNDRIAALENELFAAKQLVAQVRHMTCDMIIERRTFCRASLRLPLTSLLTRRNPTTSACQMRVGIRTQQRTARISPPVHQVRNEKAQDQSRATGTRICNKCL